MAGSHHHIFVMRSQNKRLQRPCKRHFQLLQAL